MPSIFDSNFEAAGFDGWNDTQGATSKVEQLAVASGPYRGTTGLRLTFAAGESANVSRTDAAAMAADGSLYLGFWLRPYTLPATGSVAIARMKAPSSLMALSVFADGQVRGALFADSGTTYPTTTHYCAEGTGAWIVVRLLRSSADGVSDGGMQIFVDGASVGADLAADTFDKFNVASKISYIGPGGAGIEDSVFDADDVILSYTYPNPPAGDSHIATPFCRPIATPFLG